MSPSRPSFAVWPTPALPGLVDRWIEQYHPDIVYLHVVPYWYVFESVPVRVERRFGSPGKKLAGAGVRAAGGRLAGTLPLRALRTIGLRTIGGEAHFTPEQVIEVVESCIRRIVAREDVVLAVVGSTGRRCAGYGWGGVGRDRGRRATVHQAISGLCSQLHVPYQGKLELMDAESWKALLGRDRTHLGVEAQRSMGLEQGALMLDAWTKWGRATPKPPAR